MTVRLLAAAVAVLAAEDAACAAQAAHDANAHNARQMGLPPSVLEVTQAQLDAAAATHTAAIGELRAAVADASNPVQEPAPPPPVDPAPTPDPIDDQQS